MKHFNVKTDTKFGFSSQLAKSFSAFIQSQSRPEENQRPKHWACSDTLNISLRVSLGDRPKCVATVLVGEQACRCTRWPRPLGAGQPSMHLHGQPPHLSSQSLHLPHLLLLLLSLYLSLPLSVCLSQCLYSAMFLLSRGWVGWHGPVWT